MKAIRSLELPVKSLRLPGLDELYTEEIEDRLVNIDDQRLFVVAEALRRGFSPEKINKITKYDLWFLDRFQNIVDMEDALDHGRLDGDTLRRAKEMGFSDAWIAALSGREQKEIKALRESFGIRPAFKMVDTCAAEFEAETPYYYSTYDQENEAAGASRADDGAEKRKVLVLGSGPIRIGQGIEFDYCSVHSVWAFKRLGYETIIINNNPETVSTDFDVADKLYFEPLTAEDVQAVVELEKPWGAVVQFGGQTAIKLAQALTDMGVPILGTSADGVDAAEDRERFDEILNQCGIPGPPAARCSPPSRPWPPPTTWAIPCWCAPPTCWAARAWRSPTTTATSPSSCASSTRWSRSTPSWWTSTSWAARWRWTVSSTGRSCSSPASWSTSSGPASTLATPSRSIPPSTSRTGTSRPS